jgi:hypothetical protein
LSQIRVSLCLVAPPWKGKTKHHWGSKRSKCQATTLYKSYINLSNEKQNATYTSCCKVIGMFYNRRWERLKWKDPKTYNVETHVQVDVGGVGIKEGIELGWSQGQIRWIGCLTRMLMTS